MDPLPQRRLRQVQVFRDLADGSVAGQILSNLDLGRTFAYIAAKEKEIDGLTIDEIKSAFKKHVDPNKLIIIRAGDFKK